jgi:Protein of unknown function (DUF1570)
VEVDPIMKRLLFLGAFLFLGTGTASADYVLFKINLNQMNFLPANFGGGAGAAGQGGGVGKGPGGGPMPGAGGQAGAMGFNGGAGGTPNPGGAPSTPQSLFPNDPNARYITALVEVTNVSKPSYNPLGQLFTCDTRYGKNVWVPVSPQFPMIGAPRIHADSFGSEFATKFNKEKNHKNIDTMLHLARWTLSRGKLKKFHEVMDEAVKLNDKHATVKEYLRVKKGLETPFKVQDPTQRDLVDELTRTGYKERLSEKGHYGIYFPNLDDPSIEAGVKRRLNLLEETLDSFYYWFAMQKDLSEQPALPKYRLIGIVTGSNDDFVSRHAQWGSPPRVADGFTPHRDNVIVMSAKVRVNDANYADLNSLISTKLADANTRLQQKGFKITITRENLLSGEINTIKEAGWVAMYIGAAQTAVLLAKAIEDQAERHTVTNEGTRQLLVASGMFPRNVQVPDWIIEGLAAFFENPTGGAYATIGERSGVHLISFKHHRTYNKDFASRTEVLQSVISDAYFQKARQLNKELQDSRDERERGRLKESWEVARCTSWAFIYYLSKNGKLDCIANYGKELDKLPRDMDLSSAVIQGCFAKAFAMADSNNPQVIADARLNDMAQAWFDMLELTNLDQKDGSLQKFLLEERAKQDTTLPSIPVAVGPNPNPNPGGNGVPKGWVEFTSNAGGYRSVFPDQPIEHVEDTGAIKLNMAVAEVKAQSRAFVVMYSDLPANLNANLADKALDGGIDALGKLGTVKTTSKISLGPNPGREAVIDMAGGKMLKVRIYMVGNRLYQLHAQWDSQKGDASADIDAFMNAFKLVGGGAAPGAGGAPIPGDPGRNVVPVDPGVAPTPPGPMPPSPMPPRVVPPRGGKGPGSSRG